MDLHYKIIKLHKLTNLITNADKQSIINLNQTLKEKYFNEWYEKEKNHYCLSLNISFNKIGTYKSTISYDLSNDLIEHHCSCRLYNNYNYYSINKYSKELCIHEKYLLNIFLKKINDQIRQETFKDILFDIRWLNEKDYGLLLSTNYNDQDGLGFYFEEYCGLLFSYLETVDILISYNDNNFDDFLNYIDYDYLNQNKINNYKLLKLKEINLDHKKNLKNVRSELITLNSFLRYFKDEKIELEKIINIYRYKIDLNNINIKKYKNIVYKNDWYLPVYIDFSGYKFGFINDWKKENYLSLYNEKICLSFNEEDSTCNILYLKDDDNDNFSYMQSFENYKVTQQNTFSKHLSTLYISNLEHKLLNKSSIPKLDYLVNIKSNVWKYKINVMDYEDKNSIGLSISFNINDDKYDINEFRNDDWIHFIDQTHYYDIQELESFSKKEDDLFLVDINKNDLINELELWIKKVRRYKCVEIFVDSKYVQSNQKKKIEFNTLFNKSICKLEFKMEGLTKEETQELLSKYKPNENLVKLSNDKSINISNIDIKGFENELSSIGQSIESVTRNHFNINRGLLFLLAAKENNKDLKEYIEKIENYKHDKEIPELIKSLLKEHQKEGVDWIINMFDNDFGCLLADEMGVGKTLQAITVLSIYQNLNKGKTSIVICPLSLVHNWKYEISTYAPDINCLEVIGNKEERKEIINSKNIDVLIVPYSTLTKDLDLYLNKDFLVSIVDEIQAIKNSNSQNSKSVKSIKSKYKLALTGTPIENNLLELWSIFDYIMPGLLLSKKEFTKKVSTQNEEQLKLNNETIKKIIKTFYLRREKKDVLKSLPDKNIKIMSTELSREELNKYILIKEQAISHIIKNNEKMSVFEKQTFLFKTMTKLRMHCCEPSLVDEEWKYDKSKMNLFKELLDSILLDYPNDKILVFSQFTSVLDKIQANLVKKNIKYEKLTGQNSLKERKESIHNFNTKEDIKVFLISLKAGGVGLNITSANHVIHYDPWWNLAAENQATDRSHRLGQKKVVNVYKLITNKTIEEKIIDLQNSKMNLFNDIFSDSESNRKIDLSLMQELIGFNDK